jgi:hypothetical protein
VNVVNIVNVIHMMGASCRLDRIGCLRVYFALAILDPDPGSTLFSADRWQTRKARFTVWAGGGYELGSPESWKTRFDMGRSFLICICSKPQPSFSQNIKVWC